MSLDGNAWQMSLFRTHLGLVASKSPPPVPLLFITSTRATQPSSPSTAPIHQHTAIICRCPVMNYFSRADVWAYQPLRKWQIRSLCLFMIIWALLLLFSIRWCLSSASLCCVIWDSFFHCRLFKEGEKKEMRWAGCLWRWTVVEEASAQETGFLLKKSLSRKTP